MGTGEKLVITVSADTSSDGWGFVGVVDVGGLEAYRTLRAYAAPSDALTASQAALAGVLGSLLAGQEWRRTQQDVGSASGRTELELDVSAHGGHADERAQA